jgi:hypothetical protein
MLESGHAPCNDLGELSRFKLVARSEWTIRRCFGSSALKLPSSISATFSMKPSQEVLWKIARLGGRPA